MLGRLKTSVKDKYKKTKSNITKITRKVYANDDNDQIPHILIPSIVLSNLCYSYPNYFYLGLILFDDIKVMLNNATPTNINFDLYLNHYL